MELEISVQVDKEFKRCLDKGWLETVFRTVVNALDFGSPLEASLVITSADKVQQLNREYRSKDEPTDVLAFDMVTDNQEKGVSFITPPDGVAHLGEIVISYPQAAKQAAELGHSVEEEVALLIVHGVLHLLGYDHEQPDEEEKMRAKEREIMAKICLSGEKR